MAQCLVRTMLLKLFSMCPVPLKWCFSDQGTFYLRQAQRTIALPACLPHTQLFTQLYFTHMKQTSNAIKFLMAQYRAIFKSAYFKGLATAAVVTAGLAAGAAQAADVTIPSDNAATPYNTPIKRGDVAYVGGSSDHQYVSDLVVDGEIKSITLSGDGSASASGNLYVGGTLTINQGGLLHLKASGNGWGINGYDGSSKPTPDDNKAYEGALVVNGGEVIVDQSQIQLGSITFNGGTLTLGGNFNRGSQSNARWIDNAMVNAEQSGDGTGRLTMTGGTKVTMNAGSQLMGHIVSIDNTQITFTSGSTASKAAFADNKDDKNTAFIYAYTENETGASEAGSLTLGNGAVVTVEDGAVGGIFATTNSGTNVSGVGTAINFNSGSSVTIENGGQLQIGGRPQKIADPNKSYAPEVNFNDGSKIVNEGTLTFIATHTGFASGRYEATDGSARNHNTVYSTLNRGSSIINSGSESLTEIQSGNVVILNGGEITNEGTLDIQKGATINVIETESKNADGSILNDGVATLAGNINVGGNISITGGATLEIAEGAVLSTNSLPDAGAGYIVVGNGSANNGTLKVSADTLKGFLAKGDSLVVGTGQDQAGAVLLNKGVLDLGTSANLSNFKYEGVSASRAIAGTIELRSDSTITADTLAINDVLTINNVNDSNKVQNRLTVEADNFQISADSTQFNNINSNAGNLGFKNAVVHSNLDVAYTGTSLLKVGNVYDFESYTENADGTLTAGTGTLTGRDFNLVSGGKLNVKAGHWTAAQAITLSSGASITVDTARTDDALDTVLTESSLALDGGVVFDLTATSATPTISVRNTGASYDLTSVLDLTGGIKVNGTSGSGSINVADSGATVLLNGADVTSILDTVSSNNNLDKIGLFATASGTIEANSVVTADYGDFKSGSAATAGEINLNNGGTFVAPTLVLNGSSATQDNTKLATAGTIKVNTLTLNDSNAVNSGSTTTLAGGAVNVASSLNAQSKILSIAGANVTLATTTEGLVGSLNVQDLSVSDGSLNVTQGDWSAIRSDVTVSDTGFLNVGTERTSASFSADQLSVTTDGSNKVNVYDLGEVAFTSANLANAGTGAIQVGGSMTVEGAVLDMDGDRTTGENHHGLYFGESNRGATGIFNVDGGNLTFGAEATKTFYNDADQPESGDTVTVGAQEKLSVVNGGTVTLTLSAGKSFTGAQIKDLKGKLFDGNDGSELLDGFLDIGSATLSGINVVDGAISWNDLAGYTDIVWDTTNTDLANARVDDVTYNSAIGGKYGSLNAVAGTTEVQIAHNTELSNAAGNKGNFIGDETGAAIDATIASGQILTLKGTGNVNNLKLVDGDVNDQTTTVFDATASGDAITVLGNITGNLEGETATEFTGAGTTTVKGVISVGEMDVESNLVAENDINTREVYVYGGSLQALKNVTTDSFDAKNASTTTVTGDVVLGTSTTKGYAVVEDSSSVSIKGDFTANGGFIRVGSDDISNTDIANNPSVYNGYYDSADETEDGLASNTASTGYFEVLGETRLNGTTVYVDPSYGMNTSLNTYMTFAGSNTNRGQLGTLDGNIVVGKNAAVGFGLTNAELAAKIAQYQTEGSLSENNYGSILYINGQLNVADGAYIALNGNSSHKTVEQIRAEFGSSTNGSATADLSLGNNTALIISDSAVQAAAADTTGSHNAAVKFNKTGATIYAQSDAEVLLDGTTFSLNSINLFADADGTVTLITEDGNGLDVGTVSGLFEAVLKDGETGSVTLQITREGLENTVLSNPVRQSLYDVLGEPVTPPTEGEGSGEGTGSGAEGGAEGGAGAAGEKQQATRATTVQNRYAIAQGSFIATALAEQASLQSLEQAARLGVYAGAAQAALGATSTTTDAIAGRMGVGAPNGSVTFADNGQGAALWVTPVYKNHDSDGFDAEGADYGVDMDLYGVALGADYTLANGLRIGAMFNVGSGEADGAGVGSGVSNDFDYYGFAVYGGYTYGALSIIGDISYTAVDNDFEANTGLTNYGKLESSSDSDALSFGVTGQYAFDMQSVTVTPHIGLRFTQVELDDYTVKAGGEEVVGFNTDSMNVFSIPVGVTFASDFTAGSWTVKPSVDLTVTANAGDTELDGDSTWFGTDNGFGDKTYATSTEVLDDFTYGATVGIAAKTGGFSFGLGLNYTGSSNADEFGVNANARFVF